MSNILILLILTPCKRNVFNYALFLIESRVNGIQKKLEKKKKKEETFLCLKLQELDKEQYGQAYILWRGAWY